MWAALQWLRGFKARNTAMTAHPNDDSLQVTCRNKVTRRPQRGRYDKATIHDILDAAMVGHIPT
jgi:hypothetical protein